MKDVHSYIKKRQKNFAACLLCVPITLVAWGRKRKMNYIFPFLMRSQFNEEDRCTRRCVLYNGINTVSDVKEYLRAAGRRGTQL